MIAGFNRGYNGFQQTYRTCTPAAIGRDPPLYRGRLENFARPDRALCELGRSTGTRSIFDLDGTLTDPKPGYHPARSSMRCKSSIIRRCRPRTNSPGASARRCARILSTLLGGERSPIARWRSTASAFPTSACSRTRVYRRHRRHAGGARASGHRLFVATSKPHVFADRIIDHFGLRDLFRACVRLRARRHPRRTNRICSPTR